MRERREVPRYVCDLKAHLIQPANVAGLHVKVFTISVKGSGFDSAPGLTRGQRIELKIEWENKILQAEGEVAWINDKGHVGLRFMSMGEATRALLRELCSTLKLQPIQAPEPPLPSKPKTKYE